VGRGLHPGSVQAASLQHNRVTVLD
jgi:hypothetical protein